jgi:predicted ATPase
VQIVISHFWQNRPLSAGMLLVEAVEVAILPEDCQAQTHKRKFVVRLLQRITANLVLPLLAARIDRLPPEEKRLLQTAAVIGTDVPEAGLHRGLAHLQAAEFPYETRLFPEPEYTFKHALTHEVAYNSRLLERRRMVHARLVEALEGLAPDRVVESVERLAHHVVRSGVWDKAVPDCQQAGTRAFERAAFGEAVAAFEQALQALAHLPADGDSVGLGVELHLALGSALVPLGEY